MRDLVAALCAILVTISVTLIVDYIAFFFNDRDEGLLGDEAMTLVILGEQVLILCLVAIGLSA